MRMCNGHHGCFLIHFHTLLPLDWCRNPGIISPSVCGIRQFLITGNNSWMSSNLEKHTEKGKFSGVPGKLYSLLGEYPKKRLLLFSWMLSYVVFRLGNTAAAFLLLDWRQSSHMETAENFRDPELKPLDRVYSQSLPHLCTSNSVSQ